MESYKDVIHDGMGRMDLREQNGENGVSLNFDVRSYRFSDLDLEMAVSQLPQRDQSILILHLMGHTQQDIAEIFSISRSMISKRMRVIMDELAQQLK